MDLHLTALRAGPLELTTWTLLGRVPVTLVLVALALSLVPRAGWRRAALALSGAAAGVAVGVALLPSLLGALVGALLGGALTLRLLGAPPPGALPVAAGLLAMVGVGRLGCLLNGCCFGTPTGLPWAVRQPPGAFAAGFHAHLGLVPEGAPSLPIHPWPLYEALGLALLLAALPWLARRLRSGGAAALAVAGGDLALRAALDPLRAMVNTARSAVPLGPLSAFQWGALAAAAACLAWAAWLARRARAAAAPDRPPRAAAPAGLPALAAAWAAQALAVALVSPRLTAFVAALAVATLGGAGALLLPAALADGAGRPARRRLAAALLALLLLPAGLRAAEGGERAGRHWIYAVAAQADGEPARLVRIGDQDTPEAELAAHAQALEVRHEATGSVLAGGGTQRYTTGGDGCGGPVTTYDRRTRRGGVTYERAAITSRGGEEVRRWTWQLRAAFGDATWSDTLDAPPSSTVLASGEGRRWTVGGLSEWDRGGAAVTLGALVGQDTTRDTLGPLFTRGTTVLYPVGALRLGGPRFGLEGGTLLLDDPSDRPFAGLYFGPRTFRVRTGISWATLGGPLATPAFSADLKVRAAPAWWQLHLNAAGGGEVTARVGFDLP